MNRRDAMKAAAGAVLGMLGVDAANVTQVSFETRLEAAEAWADALWIDMRHYQTKSVIRWYRLPNGALNCKAEDISPCP